MFGFASEVRHSRMKAFTLVNPSVSEFGKVEVTSTPAESRFFKALVLLKL